MRDDQTPPTSHCAACGAPFICGATAGLPTCWCMQQATLPADDLDAASGCYCPQCLQRRLATLREAAAPAA